MTSDQSVGETNHELDVFAAVRIIVAMVAVVTFFFTLHYYPNRVGAETAVAITGINGLYLLYFQYWAFNGGSVNDG